MLGAEKPLLYPKLPGLFPPEKKTPHVEPQPRHPDTKAQDFRNFSVWEGITAMYFFCNIYPRMNCSSRGNIVVTGGPSNQSML